MSLPAIFVLGAARAGARTSRTIIANAAGGEVLPEEQGNRSSRN